MSKHEHVDGPRSECPGCIAADALRAELVAAARAQRGLSSGRKLAQLVLAYLGETEAPVKVEPKPLASAPKNATEILAWTTDRYGNRRWLVVHWAQGGGEDQPPFRGWFRWSGDEHSEIDPKHILGWLPLPDRAQVKL